MSEKSLPMTRSEKKGLVILYSSLLVFVVAFAVGAIKLAYLTRGEPSRASVGSTSIVRDLPVISQVQPFELTDQNGEKISRDDLLGKVWVADIIFTRCPGPCATMTERLADLQKRLPGEVALVSITTDPDHDTPEVLKAYGERFQADPKRWKFLTGSKETIQNLATRDLKLAADEKTENRTSADDLFIHSTVLAVIDAKGQMRSAFSSAWSPESGPGSSWASQIRPQLLDTVKRLLAEAGQ